MAKKKRRRSPNIPQSSAQPVAPASGTPKRKSQRERRRQRNTTLFVGAVVVVVAIVAVLVVINNTSQSAVAAPPPPSDLDAELVSGSILGSPDAPVVITEFSDFECPACKSFAESYKDRLIEEYIKDGQVQLAYKHFPLPQHEPGATWAATAAECAGDQGRFWDMHDYLFQEQGKQGPNTFTQGRLRSMGEALGLDSDQFNQCLSREEHAQKIQDDINEARQLFVNSTPSFFVNGQLVAVPTYDSVKAAIDAALAEAS